MPHELTRDLIALLNTKQIGPKPMKFKESKIPSKDLVVMMRSEKKKKHKKAKKQKKKKMASCELNCKN